MQLSRKIILEGHGLKCLSHSSENTFLSYIIFDYDLIFFSFATPMCVNTHHVPPVCRPWSSCDHNHGWCDCGHERLPHPGGVLPGQPLCGSHSR